MREAGLGHGRGAGEHHRGGGEDITHVDTLQENSVKHKSKTSRYHYQQSPKLINAVNNTGSLRLKLETC